MAYGSRRRAEPGHGAAVWLALLLVLLSSCSPAARAARFTRALADIDGRLDRNLGAAAAFAAASRNAASGADWLSLIARSIRAEQGGDKGRAATIAGKALAAVSGSEAVAFASAYAYLRAGKPNLALALFPARLSPDARPQLWAEAILRNAELGSLPSSSYTSASLARLAAAMSEPRLFVSSAVLALAQGDPATAKAMLGKAFDAGVSISPGLLWDGGLYAELAGLPDASLSPAELCLAGDAAWQTGDFALARQRWERALARDPRASWKAYLKLAILAGEGSELQASYFERLRASFVDLTQAGVEPQALAAYAGYLARRGQTQRALGMLKPYLAEPSAGALALAIQGQAWPEDRLVAAAERFAAERPASGLALGSALRILFERGRIGDLALLYRAGQVCSLDYPYRWYYAAALDAAEGRYADSIAELEQGSAKESGPVAAYAIGTLQLLRGEGGRAVAALERARDATFDSRLQCTILKELGKAQLANGERNAAFSSWREAARADPQDAEAALLSRGGP